MWWALSHSHCSHHYLLLCPSDVTSRWGTETQLEGAAKESRQARLALSPQVLFPLLPPTPPTFLQLLVLLFPPTQSL